MVVQFNLNAAVMLKLMSVRQETPLHMAARNGSVQVAHLLVSHGSDVNARNLDDLTPLVLAAQEGNQAGVFPQTSTSFTQGSNLCGLGVLH